MPLRSKFQLAGTRPRGPRRGIGHVRTERNFRGGFWPAQRLPAAPGEHAALPDSVCNPKNMIFDRHVERYLCVRHRDVTICSSRYSLDERFPWTTFFPAFPGIFAFSGNSGLCDRALRGNAFCSAEVGELGDGRFARTAS